MPENYTEGSTIHRVLVFQGTRRHAIEGLWYSWCEREYDYKNLTSVLSANAKPANSVMNTFRNCVCATGRVFPKAFFAICCSFVAAFSILLVQEAAA